MAYKKQLNLILVITCVCIVSCLKSELPTHYESWEKIETPKEDEKIWNEKERLRLDEFKNKLNIMNLNEWRSQKLTSLDSKIRQFLKDEAIQDFRGLNVDLTLFEFIDIKRQEIEKYYLDSLSDNNNNNNNDIHKLLKKSEVSDILLSLSNTEIDWLVSELLVPQDRFTITEKDLEYILKKINHEMVLIGGQVTRNPFVMMIPY